MGYQQLRIFPYGRGMWWRCEIAPADLFDPSNGACMESKPQHDKKGWIARFSSSDACRPFGWREDIEEMPLDRLADLFIERFPKIAEKSFGPDWEYAGWYQDMLRRLVPGILPMAYSEDEYEQVVCNPLVLVSTRDELQGGEMPVPPCFVPEATPPVTRMKPQSRQASKATEK